MELSSRMKSLALLLILLILFVRLNLRLAALRIVGILQIFIQVIKIKANIAAARMCSFRHRKPLAPYSIVVLFISRHSEIHDYFFIACELVSV